jgi:cyclohexanecarboxylate-CoA ligase
VTTASDFTDTAFGPHTSEDVERYRAAGDWQDDVLFAIVEKGARAHPERVFVTDGERTISYEDLRADAIRLAAGLSALGVGRGDRVAVQMPNWAEFATITVALSRLGAILVPIMAIFRKDEVGFTLRHAAARVIIGPDFFNKFDYRGMYEQLRAEIPELDSVLIARAEHPESLGESRALESLFVDGDVDELDASLGETAGPDDPCLIVYTSGTTSRPKGCVHTFNTLHAAAIGMIRKLGVTEHDVAFCPSPVCHSTGLVTGLVLPLVAGGGTHFMPSWNPAEGLERIATYRTTMTVTATPFIIGAMQAYDPAIHDFSSMRYWVCAGAPIPGSVVQGAHARFPGCTVLSLYGRTENMITTMCGPDDPPERSAMTDGGALPGGAVKIVDRDGVEVARGEDGDIAYRGPSHMLRYHEDPENTAELYTHDGFSRSGDLAYMDADGYIRVNGRIKDIIIRGGVNISSREVEDLLVTHEAVQDAAVVSMPDSRLGERSCAFVIPRPGVPAPTLQELTDFLRGKEIAVQKLPERLELVDSFPMTAVGKVRKNVLRERVAATMAAEQDGVRAAGV